MTVFLSGGCKNGKSTLAEQIAVYLSRPGQLYYLATMIPHDEEDRLRIARHVQSRAGLGFQTVECGLGLEKTLEKADPAGSYLLDSVTALLSNEMFRPDGSVDLSAPERVAGELTTLCRRLKHIVELQGGLRDGADIRKGQRFLFQLLLQFLTGGILLLMLLL